MTQAPQKRGSKGRGRAVAIGFSLVTHLVALAILVWMTPALRIPAIVFAPDITVDLVRPVDLHRPTPNALAAPRAAASAPAVAPVQTARRAPTPLPPLPRLPAPAPARPARPEPPTPAATPTPQAPGPPAPGSVARPGPPAPPPAESTGGDVRGAVRAAIGCSHEDFLKLNAAERARCEQRMAEKPPSGAYVDPIPALKRGAFDRRALHDDRCHRYATPVQRSGPTRSIDARPVFDSAPSAVEPSGPPPPGPWTFC